MRVPARPRRARAQRPPPPGARPLRVPRLALPPRHGGRGRRAPPPHLSRRHRRRAVRQPLPSHRAFLRDGALRRGRLHGDRVPRPRVPRHPRLRAGQLGGRAAPLLRPRHPGVRLGLPPGTDLACSRHLRRPAGRHLPGPGGHGAHRGAPLHLRRGAGGPRTHRPRGRGPGPPPRPGLLRPAPRGSHRLGLGARGRRAPRLPRREGAERDGARGRHLRARHGHHRLPGHRRARFPRP
mmetsp:Transcript_7207/g.24556  ORF Transcript_7207/g.24556 Transcript_7207/m.24556 type:complete len:237 (+) Transcript_7207:215-925(+)